MTDLRIPVLRALACALLLSFASFAQAARTFPQNSFQTRIHTVLGDAIEAHGKVYHLGPGVLVYSSANTTVVHSAIPTGVLVRVQLDFQGDVRRIWVLADDEIVIPSWWRFWNRDETQQQTNPQLYVAPPD